MKKKILKIDADDWLANRRLRLCTPAARAFLIDVECLCVPSGRLEMDGQPLSDDQVAILTGTQIELVPELFKELAAANAFEVDDCLIFPDMVKDFEFKAAAKVSGAKATRKPKATPVLPAKPIEPLAGGEMLASSTGQDPFLVGIQNKTSGKPPALTKPAIPAKKIADWWLTKAGWSRMANTQAISIGSDETFENFQLRIALRIPPGPHLDVMPEYNKKKVLDEIDRYRKKEDE